MRTVPMLGAILLLACGASPPASTPAVASAAPETSAAPAAPDAAEGGPTAGPRPTASSVDAGDVVAPKLGAPSPPPAPLPASVRSPAIVKLVQAAAACKADEKGQLPHDCKAMERLLDEQAAFQDGKAGLTILSLLEDPDPRLRQAAAARSDALDAALLAAKENARRFIAVAARETNAGTAERFGSPLRRIRAEAVGLEAELFALTDHPLAALRKDLGWNLSLTQPTLTPFELAVIEKLSTDVESQVRLAAIRRLGGIRGPQEGLCRLLGRAAERPDQSGAEAVEVIAEGGCERMLPTLVSVLEAKVAAMPANESWSQLGNAAEALCRREPKVDAATRKRAFGVGSALLGKENCWARTSGIDVVEACDPTAARPLLEPLTNAQCLDLKSRAESALKQMR